jgi:hypothetical protein
MARTLRTVVGIVVLHALMSSAGPARADPSIALEARLAQAVMKTGEAHKTYLRVGLKVCDPPPSRARVPLNVALVIDRSGSLF